VTKKTSILVNFPIGWSKNIFVLKGEKHPSRSFTYNRAIVHLRHIVPLSEQDRTCVIYKHPKTLISSPEQDRTSLTTFFQININITMCFSMEMSAAFAVIGLFSSWWIWSKTSNTQLASGVFFFFTMELLQSIQYFFIAPNLDSPICDTIINQVLTIAGFLHICLQPYFCHVINASLTKNAKYIDRYLVIKRLCLIGKV
jgi:hypothetical protein